MQRINPAEMQAAQLLWNDCLAQHRADCLLTWADIIVCEHEFSSTCAEMVCYQIKHGLALINGTQIMPGPTGETNELYTAGRGVIVISASPTAPIVGVVGQLCTALLAGNAIVLALNDARIAKALQATLISAGLPEHIIGVIHYTQLERFISTENIAVLAYIGKEQSINRLDTLLAYKEGALTQLVFETQWLSLAGISAPHYILRFINERTRSNNITAVGGNAVLLALGEGD